MNPLLRRRICASARAFSGLGSSTYCQVRLRPKTLREPDLTASPRPRYAVSRIVRAKDGCLRGRLAALGVCALVIGLCGCGPKPAPLLPLTPPSADSLVARLAPDTSVAGLSVRGSLKLAVGERELPTLDFRCALRDTGEVRAILRPGILPPVLSLWAGQGGWCVHLPRDRVTFESRGAEGTFPDSVGIPASADAITGPLLARLAWFLIEPHRLLACLQRARLIERGGHWVVTGVPVDLGPEVPWAEVWVEQRTGEIDRWGLRSSEGQTLVQVTYDPPAPRPPQRLEMHAQLRFAIELLQVNGGLRISRVEAKPIEPLSRPPVPDGWDVLPGKEMRRMIQGSLEAGPAADRGAARTR